MGLHREKDQFHPIFHVKWNENGSIVWTVFLLILGNGGIFKNMYTLYGGTALPFEIMEEI